jgi:tRNA(Ile)-lysidine synthase
MTQTDLPHRLQRALDATPGGTLVVAFSGGADSTALLHALAQLPAARAHGLRAIHIDHALHPDSASWSARCGAFAQSLGVPLDLRRVVVDRQAGSGPEDAARAARHAAFATALDPDDVLVLAHHRDDQAETILLKLLRGAGPEGIGGMRAMRQCGKGYLWRPLLDTPRTLLREYLHAQGLSWIEDPSNGDTGLRRNFLRHEILPRLDTQWPEAGAALAHSATWARHAADYIASQSTQALAALRGLDPAALSWRAWLALPDALRDPVLRLWLRDLGLDAPAHFHVAELERQLRASAADRNPCVRWHTTELRRYRDLLYAMRTVAPPPAAWCCDWNGARLMLPCGGSLALIDASGGDIETATLNVRLRRGGEQLKPAGKPHTRDLRALLQEAGVPPWQRARVPLIFRGDELLAAADLCLTDAAQTLLTQLDARIDWRGAQSGV